MNKDETLRWIRANCRGTGMVEYLVKQMMQGRTFTLNEIKKLRIMLDEIGYDGKEK